MYNKPKILVKIILFIVFALTGVLLVPRSLHAHHQQIDELFKKMKKARHTVGYKGEVRVERHFGRSVRAINKQVYVDPSSRIFREQLIIKPEERERLRQAWERARGDSTIRHWDRSRRWSPDFQRNIVPEQNFADISIRLDLLNQNYEITLKSDDKVAERPVDYISIEPKYEYRPGNRLWIDKETGLILKREIFIPQRSDSPVYSEEFVTIEFLDSGELPDEKDIRTQRNLPAEREHMRPWRSQMREYRSLDEVDKRYRSTIRIPAEIPEGFVLDKIRIFRDRRNNRYQQIYTDGLIGFSLFQIRGELPEELQQRDRRDQRGPDRTGMQRETILSVKGDRYSFYIIGYARRELLKPVLDSIQPPKRRNKDNSFQKPIVISLRNN